MTISLEFLDLSENLISDYGGIVLANGLIKNETLKKLNLQKNFLDKESAKEFLKAL